MEPVLFPPSLWGFGRPCPPEPYPIACISSLIWYECRESPGSLKCSWPLYSVMLIWLIKKMSSLPAVFHGRQGGNEAFSNIHMWSSSSRLVFLCAWGLGGPFKPRGQASILQRLWVCESDWGPGFYAAHKPPGDPPLLDHPSPSMYHGSTHN